MSERFDDVYELGELSGGDDLGGPSPNRARYTLSTKPRNQVFKDWESIQSGHLFYTTPITFHNYFDENEFKQHTSRFSL